MKPLLRLEKVSYVYPGNNEPTLRDINMEVWENEILCIKGPNGSGKSTLLLVMAGLLHPTTGTVYYKEVPLHDQFPEARSKIGVLFQNPEVMMINPTVFDEIAYGPRQLFDEDTAKRKVVEVARLLGIDYLLDRSTISLSYGEKRLVALASILSYDPELLLLDEPLSNLQDSKIDRIRSLINQLKQRGKTIVLTAPNRCSGEVRCDRTLILENGTIIEIT